MRDAGIGGVETIYDVMQRRGVPIPPLAYGSFILNFAFGALFCGLGFGLFFVSYGLISAKSLDVLGAVVHVLNAPGFWFIVTACGATTGALSVYYRRRYKLTKWRKI